MQRHDAVIPGATSLAQVAGGLADAGWTLAQAQPRSATHLLLQVHDAEGRFLPGQWHADPADAERVAARTGAVLRPTSHVLLQPGGLDRRLPALAPLLASAGVELVAHRPERRAVVRVRRSAGPDLYVKVVRPGRAEPAARTLRHLTAAGLPVPAVLGTDDDQGVLALGALPGRTLHALLGGDQAGLPDLADLRAVGALVRRLHGVPPPPEAGTHTAADELAVLDRARSLAVAFGVGGSPEGETGRAGVAEALASVPAPATAVPLHRDLHDKQLLRDPATGAWSVLDLDLLALGDPAVDLANLAVHLELRAAQGLLDPALVGPWTSAVLDGYDADERTRAALGPYAAATRLRLDAVYAFRPGGG
ncbi:phosphotransferase [Nocardioides zeae]|uniref:Phosphotransferase n=1 Tax=Nocardioides imazamoxiresistens TaxID=3231893 RepID=A0ABU3Q181_9ACTN|nr:phosphotransferase [Nocardioides zeae]MDT9595258.1 phosphotransferase [Nocardioides zeae]